MLGQWEDAAADLHVASKLDYDEEIGTMLKKVIAETSSYHCMLLEFYSTEYMLKMCTSQVEPNAKRIEEHRRKYQHLRKEKELQRAERERRQQQEAQVRPIHTHD